MLLLLSGFCLGKHLFHFKGNPTGIASPPQDARRSRELDRNLVHCEVFTKGVSNVIRPYLSVRLTEPLLKAQLPVALLTNNLSSMTFLYAGRLDRFSQICMN